MLYHGPLNYLTAHSVLYECLQALEGNVLLLGTVVVYA